MLNHNGQQMIADDSDSAAYIIASDEKESIRLYGKPQVNTTEWYGRLENGKVKEYLIGHIQFGKLVINKDCPRDVLEESGVMGVG